MVWPTLGSRTAKEQNRADTGVAGSLAGDCERQLFEPGGGVQLTPAVVGHIVRAADRLVVATVADRLETLRHVEVVAHATLEVLAAPAVQTVGYHLTHTQDRTVD